MSPGVEPAAPSGGHGVEEALTGILADIVGVESVSVDSHFFNDLGADSLVMAQFCARVRKRPDLPSVSMKDIYQHPTIAAWRRRWRPRAAPRRVDGPASAGGRRTPVQAGTGRHARTSCAGRCSS